MQQTRTIETMTIESSLLCHNFINTVYAWRGENLNEYLKTYGDLLQWCQRLEVLDLAVMGSLRRRSSEHPALADAALEEIKKVRALLYRLVSAIAGGDREQLTLGLADVGPLFSLAGSKFSIMYNDGAFREELRVDPLDLQAPLWPVLRSLREMLLELDPRRIKECPTCGWVFLDKTKNRGRKWCSAVECGTRDKMARYLLKKRSGLTKG